MLNHVASRSTHGVSQDADNQSVVQLRITGSIQNQMTIYMSVVLIAGLFGGLLSAASPTSLPKAAILDLGYNSYQGVSLHNDVDQYLGMRYAKAPVHELRFRAPEDPEHNSKLLGASSVRTLRVSIQNWLTVSVRTYLCRCRTGS